MIEALLIITLVALVVIVLPIIIIIVLVRSINRSGDDLGPTKIVTEKEDYEEKEGFNREDERPHFPPRY